MNFLIKYADDATLLSPQNSKTSVELEMAHIMNRASKNKMTLNLLKTVEIVFHRPNVSHDLLPPIMHSVSRVAVAKLLGVHLRHDLNFSLQVDSVVATCNQRFYLLAQLKKQGLGISAVDSVFKPIVLNKILYALPVYFGYLTEGQRQMLQRVLHRASSRGFTQFLANVNSRSRSLYAIARPSVCRLSVVCNARAPYSDGSNFRQYFYGIWYLGHPLTSNEIFTEIVPGEPLRRGS